MSFPKGISRSFGNSAFFRLPREFVHTHGKVASALLVGDDRQLHADCTALDRNELRVTCRLNHLS